MGSIVVGVDGSETSNAAVRFAADEARLRRSTLRVVHVWRAPLAVSLPEPAVLGVPIVPEQDPELVQAVAEERGRRVLDDALGDVAGLDIERLIVAGDPAPTLLGQARGADLLVIGASHRHGVAGRVLGSVASECVRHATCPVVVVPAPAPSR
jgi:nucleotide-binding universal stress UspA family protein